MSEFYLYRHVRKDLNVPFYVGIGTKPLNYSKETQEFKRAFCGVINNGSRSIWWKNVFLKSNSQVDVEILYVTDSWDTVKEK